MLGMIPKQQSPTLFGDQGSEIFTVPSPLQGFRTIDACVPGLHSARGSGQGALPHQSLPTAVRPQTNSIGSSWLQKIPWRWLGCARVEQVPRTIDEVADGVLHAALVLLCHMGCQVVPSRTT
eukprot:7884636-Pyramimonas_sp.AAC.1